jgi:hypothetical protein
VTQLDSRLFSEYAFQRTAGAAMRLPSHDLAHKDAQASGSYRLVRKKIPYIKAQK